VLGISSKLHRGMSARDEQGLRRDASTLQLGIHYRDSSLSRHQGSAALHLHPGDRAPDSSVTRSDGQTLRLFDIFRGTHWTLLGLGECNCNALQRIAGRFSNDIRVLNIGNGPIQCEAPVTAFTDSQGHIAEFYGSANALVLIRPDGYLASISDPDSTAFVEEYLDSLLHAA
jgi:hypothetical protein